MISITISSSSFAVTLLFVEEQSSLKEHPLERHLRRRVTTNVSLILCSIRREGILNWGDRRREALTSGTRIAPRRMSPSNRRWKEFVRLNINQRIGSRSLELQETIEKRKDRRCSGRRGTKERETIENEMNDEEPEKREEFSSDQCFVTRRRSGDLALAWKETGRRD